MTNQKLRFDPFPKTYGEIQENGIEILVTSPFIKEIKDYLTAHNKNAAFQLQRLYDQRTFNEADKQNRLAQIDCLQEELHKEYYAEVNNKLSIPIGFWYLCSDSKGIENTEISTQYLPDILRDYQVESVKAALKYKRAIISLATGLGKTLCALSIVICAIKAKKRCCIIVPTIDLVRQTIESCHKLKIENVSGAGGTYLYKPGCDVLVTTVDSAYKYIDRFEVIISDEAQHLAAKTWFNLLANALTSTHVYGFSATPYRTDGMDIAIHAWSGPIVYDRSAKWGIANGWLAEPKIYMVKITGLPFVRSKTISAFAYHKLATYKKTKQYLLEKIQTALKAGRTVMVIFSTVKAGQEFKKSCVGILDFDVAWAKYRVPFNDFKEGKTNLLVGNVKLFGEGVDVPRVSCIITLCNNDSEITTRQVIGRAMRIAEGKKDAIVLDIGFDSYEPYVRYFTHRSNIYKTIVDTVKEIEV